MDLDKIKQEWIDSQLCQIMIIDNCREPQIFQTFQRIHNTSYTCHNEYWVREDDKKLYKQVIHIDKIDSIEVFNLATHCNIYKLMCEITSKSWKNKGHVRIELFKGEMFRELLKNEIEKKSLLEA